MATHQEEPIVVMAEEVPTTLTLEPLSPVHNRDDGLAPAPVPGLYDEPRRDLLRHDGRGRGSSGRGSSGRGSSGRGRGGGRAAARRAAELADEAWKKRLEAIPNSDSLEPEPISLSPVEREQRQIQVRRKCATEAAAWARHEAWKQRLEPIPNFGSLEPEPISLSPVEREPTKVPVRLTVELPFHWQKNDFGNHFCPVTHDLKKSIHGNKLKNLEHLHEKFISGEWASKAGVTYTHDVSGCIPTCEEMMSLFARGLDLKGKIVYENGGVVDEDKSNEIEKLWARFVSPCISDLSSDLKQVPVLVQTGRLFKKQKEHIDFHNAMCRRHAGRLGAPERMRVDGPGIFGQMKTMVGMDFHPPAGEYEQIPDNAQWTSYGVRKVVMCDVPDCCRMSHFTVKIVGGVELQLRANGHEHRPDIPINGIYARLGPLDIPRGSYEAMTDFLLDRLMYRRKDEINGNFDICYQCLHKKAYPIE